MDSFDPLEEGARMPSEDQTTCIDCRHHQGGPYRNRVPGGLAANSQFTRAIRSLVCLHTAEARLERRRTPPK
jgi:hypothetical protein